MSRLSPMTLLSFTSLLLVTACGGSNTSTDQHSNLLEFEQKTLEQAKALESTLQRSFNEKLGSLQ